MGVAAAVADKAAVRNFGTKFISTLGLPSGKHVGDTAVLLGIQFDAGDPFALLQHRSGE